MRKETKVYLNAEDLNAIRRTAEIFDAISEARGTSITPTTKDMFKIGDADHYINGIFGGRLFNVSIEDIKNAVVFEEGENE